MLEKKWRRKKSMKGQLSILDFPLCSPDNLKESDAPTFDKNLIIGIKGISDIVPLLPKYKIVLKNADFKGRTEKTAVWVGYFHSISDSGWNYELKEIKEYSLV